MDYDQVMVLQDGRIAEYDTPLTLLEKEKGLFKHMCLEYVKQLFCILMKA